MYTLGMPGNTFFHTTKFHAPGGRGGAVGARARSPLYSTIIAIDAVHALKHLFFFHLRLDACLWSTSTRAPVRVCHFCYFGREFPAKTAGSCSYSVGNTF